MNIFYSNAAKNQFQCCNYWSMINCEKNIILSEPACKAAFNFANQEFITKKNDAISKVCNPYTFACKDAPDLESKYPKCFAKMQLQQVECRPEDNDFRNARKDGKSCCNYWKMVECTRNKARKETVCKDVLGYIDYIWSPQNKDLIQQYCNPNWYKCDSIPPDPNQQDPNASLRKKYPSCFAKIDQFQKSCESKKNKDYSNAFNDKSQCCGYWAMIGCTRTLAIMQDVCKPLQSYINNWFSTSNTYLINQHCPSNKFKCRKNNASFLTGNTILLVMFNILAYWISGLFST